MRRILLMERQQCGSHVSRGKVARGGNRRSCKKREKIPPNVLTPQFLLQPLSHPVKKSYVATQTEVGLRNLQILDTDSSLRQKGHRNELAGALEAKSGAISASTYTKILADYSLLNKIRTHAPSHKNRR